LKEQQLFVLTLEIDSLLKSFSIFETNKSTFQFLRFFFTNVQISFTWINPSSSSFQTWCSSYVTNNDNKQWLSKIIYDNGHLQIVIICDLWFGLFNIVNSNMIFTKIFIKNTLVKVTCNNSPYSNKFSHIIHQITLLCMLLFISNTKFFFRDHVQRCNLLFYIAHGPQVSSPIGLSNNIDYTITNIPKFNSPIVTQQMPLHK